MANHFLKQIKPLLQSYAQKNSKLCLIRLKSVVATKLVYSEYGEPSKVLKKENEDLTVVRPNELLIKMLASPVNPADINTIQGAYAVKPKLPAVGGNEGVGEVLDVGNEVVKAKKGDWVVPLTNALGTWRTHVVLPEEHVFKVPKQLGLVEAATFTVNPATAYRMLKDFATLKPDDVVIQNGGNSACGQYVIQLCKAWGIKSVNIIRDRPNVNELKEYLKVLGATYVFTEEELRKTDIFGRKIIPRPKVALNCVGGKSATEILRQLEDGGVMVTYGGMSREPVTVPISALIFKDVEVLGFWMTRWSINNAKSPERFKMLEELVDLMKSGKIHGPACEFIQFDDFQYALENTMTMKGMVGKKFILEYK